jgi:CubicO group peptidase (beta-lactamase class C family)
MEDDTVFWLASLSKPISASALMMLVDDGAIALDDPISEYLPAIPPRGLRPLVSSGRELENPPRTIVIRDLLRHTTGLNPGYADRADTSSIIAIDSIASESHAEMCASAQPVYYPGRHFAYSNLGFDLIAALVRSVTGVSFDCHIQERLLIPLGMTDTTFWPSPSQLRRLAKNYGTQDSTLVSQSFTFLTYPLDDRITRHASPGGGLFSTANDIVRFAQMILRGGELNGTRYLAEKSIAEMRRNQLDEPARDECRRYLSNIHYPADLDGYGLGWATSESDAFGHEGVAGTALRIDPRRGVAIVWLIQNSDPVGGAVDIGFRRLLSSLIAPRDPKIDRQ